MIETGLMGDHSDWSEWSPNKLFSRGSHVESPENKKLCFCQSKLAVKSFNARLDGQNVLFSCKIVAV